jgi:lysophospholipase L1-like esterase
MRYRYVAPGRATSLVLAATAIGLPGTLGVVVGNQISRARRGGFLPRPEYKVDLLVDPPWVHGPPLRVAFLGDSLVEGVGAPAVGQSLPAQTAYRLAAHLGRPVHMRGLGVASVRLAGVLADQVPQLDEDVDVVLVLAGANDATGRTPPWEFGRTVELLTAEVHRTTGAPTVFMGLPDIHSAPLLGRPLRDLAGAFGDHLHGIQQRLAVRIPEARYLDMRAAVGDAFRHGSRELFSEDRYHPNPAGYALLAESIARPLAELLRAEGLADVDLPEADPGTAELQALPDVA